ncbi:response regulator [Fusobacterium naviforme]|nr:response regulator [Fusobacterium naviforme]
MRERMKIVVVEDEYYVRKGLRNEIDWAAWGCEIVGEAENGMRGVEVIEKLRPQLVIADIEMPMMSGIDMVRQLKIRQVEAEYIFLTSHQNFTYVYQAIKLDVIDYLLKPFHREDLETSIQKARLKLHFLNREEEKQLLLSERELGVKNSLVREAVSYVREHYAEEISSVRMAEHLNISAAYFCRIFKKETGYTFSQYLVNYRIHIAAGMLANFDLRISEVAAQVGIVDSNYFSQLFKRIMGVTPTEYQNEKGHLF